MPVDVRWTVGFVVGLISVGLSSFWSVDVNWAVRSVGSIVFVRSVDVRWTVGFVVGLTSVGLLSFWSVFSVDVHWTVGFVVGLTPVGLSSFCSVVSVDARCWFDFCWAVEFLVCCFC